MRRRTRWLRKPLGCQARHPRRRGAHRALRRLVLGQPQKGGVTSRFIVESRSQHCDHYQLAIWKVLPADHKMVFPAMSKSLQGVPRDQQRIALQDVASVRAKTLSIWRRADLLEDPSCSLRHRRTSTRRSAGPSSVALLFVGSAVAIFVPRIQLGYYWNV